MEETQRNVVDLVRSWKNGDTAHRQEVAFNLFAEELRFSRETQFLNRTTPC